MSTNTNRNFAAFLATLEPNVHLTPLTTISISTSPSSCDLSPLKRPRSDSPDTSVSSIDPTDSFSLSSPQEGPPDLSSEFFHYTSSTIQTASSTSCTLRSILTACSAYTSPLVSPSISRPLSRRSSSSGKSVRFARCTNASVFPALSGEEYDRTPIVPSTESESLELPRRKAETEGWIKCLQKRKAADEKAKGCAAWSETPTSASNSPVLPSERTVEGFHGMVEGKTGGYFVGEERAERMESELEEERSRNGDGDENGDDDMVVDDQEENEDEEDNTSMVTTPKPNPASSLQQQQQQSSEDTSSGGEDESDGFGTNSITSASGGEGGSPPSSISSHCDTVMMSTSKPISSRFSMERSQPNEEDDDDDEEEEEEETEEEKLRREEEEERIEELERSRKTKARYGICALGKYSRAEVFQSHDSLGGF